VRRLEFTIAGPLPADEDGERNRSLRRLLGVLVVLFAAAYASDSSRRGAPLAELGAIDDFGVLDVRAREGVRRTVTLRNPGQTELRIDSVALDPGPEAAFRIVQEDCSHRSLQAEADCRVELEFLPRRRGPHQATLTLHDNAADSPQSVALAGTGIAPAASLRPVELLLSAEVGSSVKDRATVSNPGDAPLQLRSVSFGEEPRDFGLEVGDCKGPIAPGGDCEIEVSFSPRREGLQLALLTIDHDAGDDPLLLRVVGSGSAAPTAPEPTPPPAPEPVSPPAPDRTPPDVPQPLAPGTPDAAKPENLYPCEAVILEWKAVSDDTEPVTYVLTLQNERRQGGQDGRPGWYDVFAPRVVDATSYPVSSSVTSIVSGAPTVDAGPRSSLAERLRGVFRRRETKAGDRPGVQAEVPFVSLPRFLWRVTARDAAGNESEASPPLYFECTPPPIL
jgi:HYDIN/CFA65/VesB family protein